MNEPTRTAAALDALVAQVDTLTRERDAAVASMWGTSNSREDWRRWATEQRDRADSLSARAEAAEAALADTRRALEEIAALPVPGADGWMEIPAERPMQIARRALAGDTEETA